MHPRRKPPRQPVRDILSLSPSAASLHHEPKLRLSDHDPNLRPKKTNALRIRPSTAPLKRPASLSRLNRTGVVDHAARRPMNTSVGPRPGNRGGAPVAGNRGNAPNAPRRQMRQIVLPSPSMVSSTSGFFTVPQRTQEQIHEQERRAVLSYLVSPSCGLFKDKQSTVSLPESELDRLIKIAGSATAAIEHLSYLDDTGNTFHGLSSLVQAMNRSIDDRIHTLVFLTLPSNCLFEDPSIASFLNMAAVNKLFEEGGEGFRTLAILQTFVASGRKFEGFRDIIKAVRCMHFAETPRSYSGETDDIDDVSSSDIFNKAKEESSMGHSLQETEDELDDQDINEQDVELFATLCSQDSDLFDEGSDNTNINTETLRFLIHQGGSVSCTSCCLRSFNEEHRKFQSVEALGRALRQARLLSFDQKQAIRKYLENTTLLPPGLEVAHCDLDRIFERGAGPATLKYLVWLECDGRSFRQPHSIDKLQNAIRTIHSHTLRYRQGQYNLLTCHLQSAGCQIFYESPSVSLQSVSRLYDLLETGPSALLLLEELRILKRHFTSMHEFLNNVTDHDTRASQRKLIHSFLKQIDCTLLTHEQGVRVEFTDEDVETLLDVGAGGETVIHLWILDAARKQFRTFNALIDAVRHSFTESRNNARARESVFILTYLLNPYRRFFSTQPVRLLQQELDELYKLADDKASEALRLVHAAEMEVAEFGSFKELIQAIRKSLVDEEEKEHEMIERIQSQFESQQDNEDNQTSSFKQKARMLIRRNTKKESLDLPTLMTLMKAEKERQNNIREQSKQMVFQHLSHDKSGLLPQDCHLDGSVLDRLLKAAAESGASLILHLHLLEEQGNQYDTAAELATAIRDSRNANKRENQVLEYLTSKDCKLFNRQTTVSPNCVKKLMKQVKVGKDPGSELLIYLRMFSLYDKKFDDMQSLADGVQAYGKQIEQKNDDLLLVLCAHFLRENAQLIDKDDKKQTKTMIKHEDLIRLLHAGETPYHTYFHLEHFEDMGQSFESLNKLISAIQYAMLSEQSEKRELLKYLQANITALFPLCHHQIKLNEETVDTLWKHARAGPQTQSIIEHMGSPRFESFDALLEAVSADYFSLAKQHANRRTFVLQIQEDDNTEEMKEEQEKAVVHSQTESVLDVFRSEADGGVLPYAIAQALSSDDAAYIIEQVGDYKFVLEHAKVMRAGSVTFRSLREYCLALRDDRLALLYAQDQTYEYLNKGKIMTKNVRVSRIEVRDLFRSVMASHMLADYLKPIEKAGKRFGGVEHLAVELKKIHAETITSTSSSKLADMYEKSRKARMAKKSL